MAEPRRVANGAGRPTRGDEREVRIGLVDVGPVVADRVARARPDAQLSRVGRGMLLRPGDAGVDLVVAPAAVLEEMDTPQPGGAGPRLVVLGESSLEGPGVEVVPPEPKVADLQLAIDRCLEVGWYRRTIRNLRIEQDDVSLADQAAFILRSVVGLLTLLWVLLAILPLSTWALSPLVPTVLIVWLIARALWWRLGRRLVWVDIGVAFAITMAQLAIVGQVTTGAVLLPLAVLVQVGYVFGAARAHAVLVAAVLLGAGLLLVVSPSFMGGAAVIIPLAALLLGTTTGALLRLVSSSSPGTSRQLELQQFRQALYELSEQQAAVAVPFDHGAAAEDVLRRLLLHFDPVAALVLVREPNGPLGVAAAHNLAAPPPSRLSWPPEDDVRAGARLDAGHPGQVLGDVVRQLEGSLPTEAVLSQPAVVDGTLLGGLVLVLPPEFVTDVVAMEAVAEDLRPFAAEAAQSFDSVNLFQRLRAFALDQERARIARSLHDGVMQVLSHVGMQLDMAVRDDEIVVAAGDLQTLRGHVISVLDEMRTVVNDLRTASLDRGLAHALDAMVASMTPATGPTLRVEAEDIRGLGPDAEEQLLRIAQEAVSNALRHADASEIVVRLHRRDEWVVLQIADDGRGLVDAGPKRDSGGVGMTSIRQRAAAMGGRIDIDASHGMLLTVLCPWRPRLNVAPAADSPATPAPPLQSARST